MKRLTLVMTHQCNFRCRYCLQKHEDVHMSRETAFHAVDLLAEQIRLEKNLPRPKVQISFYGGEPLIAEELIKEVISYAEEKLLPDLAEEMRFEITTNGLLLKDEFLPYAKKHKIMLALSHDGLGQDFGRIDRGGNPTKERVDEVLKRLLSYFPKTVIMMTLHPEMVSSLTESIKFFRDAGVDCVNLTLAHGEKIQWTKEHQAELISQLETLAEYYVEWNQGDSRFRFAPFDVKIRNYILGKSSDDRMCHFMGDKLMVDVDGRFFPCNHFIGNEEFLIGNVEEGPDMEKIQSLDRQRVEPETCRDCGYKDRCRHLCACANHGHTGSMCQVSRLQCEYEKNVIRLADQAAQKLMKPENTCFLQRMYKD